MANRTLNTLQVGLMLVSTSCGIGFLLGTGELAVHQGIVGCLYAVATALGLIVLASYAPALWASGHSIWREFDLRHGPSVGRSVALLSLVWMTGVLAAQIRGGSAVLALTGLPRTSAELLVVLLIIGLSLMRLSWLSTWLGACLLACNVLLAHSLFETGKLHIWLRAPITLANDLPHTAPTHAGFVLISVATMVVCGADYQQFAIAARRPSTAVTGCLLAAALVFAIGFLPASAVIAAGIPARFHDAGNSVQIIPMLLVHDLPSSVANVAWDLIVFVLVTIALGSASSVLRAMSDATATLGPPSMMRPIWSRALPILLATLVASRAQSLIDMMVELNVVYIAAVGPLMMLRSLRIDVCEGAANAAIAVACAISVGGYVIQWTTSAVLPEVVPLAASIGAALVVAVSYPLRFTTSSDTSLSKTTPISTREDPHPSVEGSPGCSDNAGDD